MAPIAFVGLILICVLYFADELQMILGFKICLTVDDDGVPIFRLVRVGSRIPGLGVGALLVATDVVRGGIFDRSVIVLTRHDEYGAIGYIVNVPGDAVDPMVMPRRHFAGFENGPPLQDALAVPEAPEAVQHGVGGPVDLDEPFLIHGFDRIAGATPLGELTGYHHRLYMGGDLASVRARAREAVRARAAAAVPPSVEPPVLVRALHGRSAWAAGQLEGEIKRGVWEWAPGVGLDFALGRNDRAPSHTMWHRALAAIAIRRATLARERGTNVER